MSANIAQFTFGFLDVDYQISVLDYFAVEKVSYLSGVNLTLVSNSQDIIHSKDVIRQEGLLTIITPYGAGDPDRYFHGIIRKFRYIGKNGSFHTYEAQLVPSLWLFSLKTKCRIFQDMETLHFHSRNVYRQR
jgi:type VI secretion system secreted protein VgrG